MTDLARVPDTSRYYGYDGLNFSVIKSEFNGVIFCAGVGVTMDYALPGSIETAKRTGTQYCTYHIPSPQSKLGISVVEQAQEYLSWPGVKDAVCIADFEPPARSDPRMVSAAESQQYMTWITGHHSDRPRWYSNAKYTSQLGWPHFLTGYDLIAAWYPYCPPNWNSEFADYESFLSVWNPLALPPWVRNTIYASRCIGWQFTSHGRTPDISQTNTQGGRKKDHDFIVSCVDKEIFMSGFWSGGAIDPEPPQEDFGMVTVVNCNVLNLRSDHVVSSATDTGDLNAGEIVVVYEVWSDPVNTGNIWFKVARGNGQVGWAAAHYGGKTYLVSK